MQIYYISNARLPSEKAHTIQQVNMAAALDDQGIDTVFVHPSFGQGSISGEKVEEFYGISANFVIKTLPSFSSKNPIPNVPTSGEIVIFCWLLIRLLLGRFTPQDIIYSRHLVPTWGLLVIRKIMPNARSPTMIFEQHQQENDHPLVSAQFYNRLDGLVCISAELQSILSQEFGIDPSKIEVAHDGVDLSKYESIDQEAAREALDLEPDETYIVYTGHLYPEKNVEQLIAASASVEGTVLIVGGYDSDIDRLQEGEYGLSNVRFTGFINPSKIATYQKAADVLVAPILPGAEFYSPLKLFEYMASGKPIVANRTESFEEVLTENSNCLFVDSLEPSEMAERINHLVEDRALCQSMGAQNQEDAKEYSWNARSERIISFINGIRMPP